MGTVGLKPPSIPGHGDAVVAVINNVGLAAHPPVLRGRHRTAGALHADEGALDVAVGDAQANDSGSGNVLGALVLPLGAGHGQVGAVLLTGRLRVSVV